MSEEIPSGVTVKNVFNLPLKFVSFQHIITCAAL